MNYQKLFKILAAVLMIGCTIFLAITNASAALDITKNVKSYEGDKYGYGEIVLKDWFGLGKEFWKGKLEEHTEYCGTYCSSIINIVLDSEGKLFDSVKFYTINSENSRTEQPIKSYKFYLQSGINTVEVPVNEWVCTKTGKEIVNESGRTEEEKCEYKQTGTRLVDSPEWTEYTGAVMPKGSYVLKLEGQKFPSRKVDWVLTVNGESLDEWATWGAMSSLYLNNGLKAGYNLDEGSGTLVTDILSQNNGTLYGTWRLGIIGSSANFTAVNKNNITVPSSTDLNFGTGEGTISVWLYENTNAAGWTYSLIQKRPDLTGDEDGYRILFDGDDRIKYYFTEHATPHIVTIGAGSHVGGQWYNVILMRNASCDVSIYWNASIKGYYNDACVTQSNTNNLYLGGGGTGYMDGAIDNVYLWNRSLTQTEINDVFNNGLSIKYPFPTGNVILNSPANNYLSNTTSITFNGTATVVGANLVNISLWTNSTGTWKLNQTAFVTGTTNTSIFTLGLVTGNSTLWAYQACADDGTCGFSDNRTVRIDVTSPTLNITYPSGAIPILTNGQNVTFNYTASDPNLNSCWFNYNSTNRTLTCGTNSSFIYVAGLNSIILYANDSVGNTANYTSTFSPTIQVNSINYNNPVLSGTTQYISHNITYNSSMYSSVTSTLVYNNTVYTPSIIGSGNNLVYNTSVLIPTILSPSSKTFYANFILTNLSGSVSYYNSTIQNQSINPLQVDNCSLYSSKILNFTLFDEDTLLQLNGTIELTTTFYSEGNPVSSYNNSYNFVANNGAVSVCINQSTSASLLMDYQARYYSNTSLYPVENKFGQKLNVSATTQIVNLYNLLDARSTSFQIILQGADLSTISGALIDIQRQYVPLNQFISVETPLTDPAGNTLGHLVGEDVYYRFVVTKDNVLLGTFDKPQVACQNIVTGDCRITLNLIESTATIPDFYDYGNISVNYLFNKNTRTLLTTWITADTNTHAVSQNVTLLDNFGNQSICSISATGTSGTFTCIVPSGYGNTSIISYLYSDGNFIGYNSFNFGDDSTAIFDGAKVILGMLMYTTLTLMMIANPVLIIIGSILGIVFAMSFHVVDGGSWLGNGAIFIWFIIAGGIVIFQLTRRNNL